MNLVARNPLTKNQYHFLLIICDNKNDAFILFLTMYFHVPVNFDYLCYYLNKK